MRPVALAPVIAIVALTAGGCGSSETATKTVTVTKTETVTAATAASAAAGSSSESAQVRKTRRAGEIVIEGDNQTSIPRKFSGGVYRVQWRQWAPENPDLDFRTESSSFMVQLRRKPGVIDGRTVHVINATKEKGSTYVTVPAGRWYIDVGSADHLWSMRFTPSRG